MRLLTRRTFTVFLLCGIAATAFAQTPPGMLSSSQAQRLDKMKSDNPDLYRYEKRLWDIHQEAQKILDQYVDQTMSKADAKEKLAPLLKEEGDILKDPQFVIERRLDAAIRMKSRSKGVAQPEPAPTQQ